MRTVPIDPEHPHGSFSIVVDDSNRPDPKGSTVELLAYHGYRRVAMQRCFSSKKLDEPEVKALYDELLRQAKTLSDRVSERDKVAFVFRMKGNPFAMALYAVLGHNGFAKVSLEEDAEVAPDGEMFY